MNKREDEDLNKTPAQIEAASPKEERLRAVKEFREHVDTKYYAMSAEKIREEEAWIERNSFSVTQGNNNSSVTPVSSDRER